MNLENILHKVKMPIAIGGAAAYLVVNSLTGCASPTPTPAPAPAPAPTKTYTPEHTQEPAPTETPVYEPTPSPTPPPIITPEPTPSPTPPPIITPEPTPPPLEIIIQGDIPAPISIDLSTIQYEPIVSYEGKLGNTDVTLKKIFERGYYDITGKTFEKVLTKDNKLEDRLKIFLMSEQELVKKFGPIAKYGITKSNVLTAADGSYVTGMNAYFNKNYPVGQVYDSIAILAHEALGHAYAYMYEPNDLAWKESIVRETVADIREVSFIRYLEENYGLTAYKVSNNQANKNLAQNLVKSFLGEPSTNVRLQAYKGIWNEVLNNPQWHDEAVKGRLSVETLWDISVYVLKQPSWTPPDKLTVSQQKIVKDILISRFEPSAGYNGKLNEKPFDFP